MENSLAGLSDITFKLTSLKQSFGKKKIGEGNSMFINLRNKGKNIYLFIWYLPNCCVAKILFTYQWLCPEISSHYKSLVSQLVWNEATEVVFSRGVLRSWEKGAGITEAVSWDSLLLAGFRSQVPLGFKGEERQGRFDWMGLFVGTARLNACHSLKDQLGSAESPIGVDQHSCQISHRHTNTLTHISELYLSWLKPNFKICIILGQPYLSSLHFMRCSCHQIAEQLQFYCIIVVFSVNLRSNPQVYYISVVFFNYLSISPVENVAKMNMVWLQLVFIPKYTLKSISLNHHKQIRHLAELINKELNQPWYCSNTHENTCSLGSCVCIYT